MNNKQFFDLVTSMRTAQKEYFAHRTPDALSRARRLEAEVDTEIRRVIQVLESKKPDQLQLNFQS